MIELAFLGPQREVLRFEIKGKVVRYFDKFWMEGIQIMPEDKELVKKLKFARNSSMTNLAKLIASCNQGKNLRQYNSCNTEEELAAFIIKDCESNGLRQI